MFPSWTSKNQHSLPFSQTAAPVIDLLAPCPCIQGKVKLHGRRLELVPSFLALSFTFSSAFALLFTLAWHAVCGITAPSRWLALQKMFYIQYTFAEMTLACLQNPVLGFALLYFAIIRMLCKSTENLLLFTKGEKMSWYFETKYQRHAESNYYHLFYSLLLSLLLLFKLKFSYTQRYPMLLRCLLGDHGEW